MSTALAPNGNICLTFEDHASRQLVKFAHKYFSDTADGYLLGPACIPHITLSQIHHDKPQPRALRRDLGNLAATPDPLFLDTLTQRAGTGAHDGYTWLEFSLKPIAPWLIELKNKVDAILHSYDMTILTPPVPDWHPHLTVCRTRTSSKPIVLDALNHKTGIDAAELQLSLGSSDANGQFQKVYWKRSLL